MSNYQMMENQTQSSSEEREFSMAFISLLVLSPASTIAYIMIMLLDDFHTYGEINQSMLVISIFLAGPFALIVSSIYALFTSVPALAIGWYFNMIRWWSSMVVGFSLGFIFPMLPLAMGTRYAPQVWVDASIIGLAGAIGALTFWLTWRFLSNFKLHRQEVSHVKQ